MWVGTYILDKEGNLVPVDTLTWGFWLEEHHEQRVVRQDSIHGVRVSTVFLGLDHYYPRDAPHEPVLWETMIFGGPKDRYLRRYTSLEAAKAGHIEAMMMIEPWSKDIVELNRMLSLAPDWERR